MRRTFDEQPKNEERYPVGVRYFKEKYVGNRTDVDLGIFCHLAKEERIGTQQRYLVCCPGERRTNHFLHVWGDRSGSPQFCYVLVRVHSRTDADVALYIKKKKKKKKKNPFKSG